MAVQHLRARLKPGMVCSFPLSTEVALKPISQPELLTALCGQAVSNRVVADGADCPLSAAVAAVHREQVFDTIMGEPSCEVFLEIVDMSPSKSVLPAISPAAAPIPAGHITVKVLQPACMAKSSLHEALVHANGDTASFLSLDEVAAGVEGGLATLRCWEPVSMEPVVLLTDAGHPGPERDSLAKLTGDAFDGNAVLRGFLLELAALHLDAAGAKQFADAYAGLLPQREALCILEAVWHDLCRVHVGWRLQRPAVVLQARDVAHEEKTVWELCHVYG